MVEKLESKQDAAAQPNKASKPRNNWYGARRDDPTHPKWRRTPRGAQAFYRYVAWLVKLPGSGGECWPKIPHIGRELGDEASGDLSKSTVLRIIKAAKKSGFVTVDRREQNYYWPSTPPLDTADKVSPKVSPKVSSEAPLFEQMEPLMTPEMTPCEPVAPISREKQETDLHNNSAAEAASVVAEDTAASLVQEATAALVAVGVYKNDAQAMARRDARLAVMVAKLTSEKKRTNPGGFARSAFEEPERYFIQQTDGAWRRKGGYLGYRHNPGQRYQPKPDGSDGGS